MNCCDDYGNCTRGKDCPARPAMLTHNSEAGNPEAGTNHPWDWIDRLGFWWVCALAGGAVGIGYGTASLIKRFFN